MAKIYFRVKRNGVWGYYAAVVDAWSQTSIMLLKDSQVFPDGTKIFGEEE